MVIGVTGTNGAGKGAAVDYLVSKGFKHYSVRDFLIAEIERRGLEVIRPNMRLVANEFRTKHEPAYIIRTLHEQAITDGVEDVVIESIRNSGEMEYLKSKGGIILAIDADRKIRYERIQARASETDTVDFKTFVEQEENEWYGKEGKADMDLITVIKNADYTILNEGTKEEFHEKIERFLAGQ